MVETAVDKAGASAVSEIEGPGVAAETAPAAPATPAVPVTQPATAPAGEDDDFDKDIKAFETAKQVPYDRFGKLNSKYKETKQQLAQWLKVQPRIQQMDTLIQKLVSAAEKNPWIESHILAPLLDGKGDVDPKKLLEALQAMNSKPPANPDESKEEDPLAREVADIKAQLAAKDFQEKKETWKKSFAAQINAFKKDEKLGKYVDDKDFMDDVFEVVEGKLAALPDNTDPAPGLVLNIAKNIASRLEKRREAWYADQDKTAKKGKDATPPGAKGPAGAAKPEIKGDIFKPDGAASLVAAVEAELAEDTP
jgi:hypothetical protein